MDMESELEYMKCRNIPNIRFWYDFFFNLQINGNGSWGLGFFFFFGMTALLGPRPPHC